MMTDTKSDTRYTEEVDHTEDPIRPVQKFPTVIEQHKCSLYWPANAKP